MNMTVQFFFQMDVDTSQDRDEQDGKCVEQKRQACVIIIKLYVKMI